MKTLVQRLRARAGDRITGEVMPGARFRPAWSLPFAAAAAVTGGVVTLTVKDEFRAGWVAVFAIVSAAAGSLTAFILWRRDRRGSFEDVVGAVIASALTAGLAATATFVVVYAALGGGR